ncbi:NusG domain II-containing protein [Chitiniphilus eburneus]|uniref:NusG domain II-containing protein n=1 Tax=Chitiniphilus eburneus TaxID=2571148 RepID=A0A4U0QDB5_9NEIS|nr:NusG domain II-containing protein [Chitiniphilus eburneus]TJZ79140.1 NusG domain II-containing protein [Chitiniphilus eburneus]
MIAALRPGDWLILSAGAILVGWLATFAWQQAPATRVRIYSAGKLYAEVDLAARRHLDVPGPLGITRVEIDRGRARVAADPGPRQYCVQTGWLIRAGESAICLPNRTTVALVGQDAHYDALGY